MSASDENLKFCEEGHVFDLSVHEKCPICGSPVAGGGDDEDDQDVAPDAPAPRPATGGDRPPRPNESRGEAHMPGAVEQILSSLSSVSSTLSSQQKLYIGGGFAAVLAIGLVLLLMFSGDQSGAHKTETKTNAGTEDRLLTTLEEEAPSKDKSFDAATAEPYGTWETFINLSPMYPHWRQVFQIFDDGSYILHDKVYGHAGRMTFTGRHYQLKSRTNVYEDEGVYSRPDADTIVFEGRLGRSVWTAVKQTPLFTVTAVAPIVPTDIPSVLKAMTADSRAVWRDDAVPVGLEIERNKYNSYDIEARFWSPTDNAGYVLTWAPFEASEYEHEAVSWSQHELPERFLDLPDAYAVLDQKSVLKRATLNFNNNGVLLWLLVPSSGRGGGVDARVN